MGEQGALAESDSQTALGGIYGVYRIERRIATACTALCWLHGCAWA